jgi:hypothetical protein
LNGIVRRARLCVVRDELTRELLKDCSLPPPVPCPTLAAVPTAGGAQRRLLHVDHYDNVGAAVYERMVAEAEQFAGETGRGYRQTNNLIPAGHRGALQKTLDLYASADLVVTSRLHGCILALATGRRVLAVSADHKVESFMQAAGLRDWVLDLDDIGQLPERLRALERQPSAAAFVERSRGQLRDVAAQVRILIGPRALADAGAQPLENVT